MHVCVYYMIHTRETLNRSSKDSAVIQEKLTFRGVSRQAFEGKNPFELSNTTSLRCFREGLLLSLTVFKGCSWG